jgi:hypothetical protein
MCFLKTILRISSPNQYPMKQSDVGKSLGLTVEGVSRERKNLHKVLKVEKVSGTQKTTAFNFKEVYYRWILY